MDNRLLILSCDEFVTTRWVTQEARCAGRWTPVRAADEGGKSPLLDLMGAARGEQKVLSQAARKSYRRTHSARTQK